MTDDEIRIAVAEELGWEVLSVEVGIWRLKAPDGRCWDKFSSPDNAWSAQCIPDYPNDLNACHEMEERLNREESREYTRLLHPKYIENLSADWVVLRSTAHQRCEAFLRVKGKWKDDLISPVGKQHNT